MACIPPTLEGWVYITPTHGPLDGPLYTWAQYTPTAMIRLSMLWRTNGNGKETLILHMHLLKGLGINSHSLKKLMLLRNRVLYW